MTKQVKHADNWMSVRFRDGPDGKSAGIKLENRQGEPTGEPMMEREAFKKEPLVFKGDRTKTDTGG